MNGIHSLIKRNDANGVPTLFTLYDPYRTNVAHVQ